jgi:hypothetical protein
MALLLLDSKTSIVEKREQSLCVCSYYTISTLNINFNQVGELGDVLGFGQGHVTLVKDSQTIVEREFFSSMLGMPRLHHKH